jgi:hypothetical protein
MKWHYSRTLGNGMPDRGQAKTRLNFDSEPIPAACGGQWAINIQWRKGYGQELPYPHKGNQQSVFGTAAVR